MEVRCPDWLSLQLCLQNFKLSFPKERFLDSVSQLVCVCVCMHTFNSSSNSCQYNKIVPRICEYNLLLFTLCHLQDLIF